LKACVPKSQVPDSVLHSGRSFRIHLEADSNGIYSAFLAES